MEGTNYIDHRFQCEGMIKHIVIGKGRFYFHAGMSVRENRYTIFVDY